MGDGDGDGKKWEKKEGGRDKNMYGTVRYDTADGSNVLLSLQEPFEVGSVFFFIFFYPVYWSVCGKGNDDCIRLLQRSAKSFRLMVTKAKSLAHGGK